MVDETHNSEPHAYTMEDLLEEIRREDLESNGPNYDGPARTPAISLLSFVGTWIGDDVPALYAEMKRLRGKAQF